jgi:hypothetical protein
VQRMDGTVCGLHLCMYKYVQVHSYIAMSPGGVGRVLATGQQDSCPIVRCCPTFESSWFESSPMASAVANRSAQWCWAGA